MGMTPLPPADRRPEEELTDDHIARVARSGNTIAAIRLYRTLHAADLRTARDAVEKLAGG